MSDDKVYEGVVVFFQNKLGYGFIEWLRDGEKQPDIFLHFSDINSEGFRTVKAEQKVTFRIGKNNRGQDKAIEVTPIN